MIGMRIALYVRTSTKDGRQHLENQIEMLTRYASAYPGWEIVGVYQDRESGSAGPGSRPELARLFRDAAKRQFDLVLVWSLDRFCRSSIPETFNLIARLRDHGVEFWSMTEEHFRTTGVAGDLLLAVSAWIANWERLRIRDRIQAGMERARNQGKQFGRPRAAVTDEELTEWRANGVSVVKIAKRTGVPVGTIKSRFHQIRRRESECLTTPTGQHSSSPLAS